MMEKAYIPYGGYYSTPFCKWQGALQNENSLTMGADVARAALEAKKIQKELIEYLYVGHTMVQSGSFYAAPYVGARIGIRVPGQAVAQACATSTTTIFNAAAAVELEQYSASLCVLTDKISNAPLLIWPHPAGMGGEPVVERGILDNINNDPSPGAGVPMIETAENVAKKYKFTRQEADELVLRRYEQYQDALANDRAFQKRYMMPIELKTRKKTVLVTQDEGVTTTSLEALAKLKSNMADGIHTFGSQTHPADGSAGIIVASREKAGEMSKDSGVEIRIIGYGASRAEAQYMPAAPADAAKEALRRSGVKASELRVIKNHSPFIVNDLHLSKELGVDRNEVNNYGTSLVYGHPQGPTVARLLIEAIEETVMKGGGYAMVAGCAAGDTAAALVIKVE